MAPGDPFAELARHYDPLMAHVDYGRWFFTADALTELLPPVFTHVDAGCGTGVFLERTRGAGWRSAGVDLSPAMLRSARRTRGALPVAVADLRALPLHNGAHFITCLFDSLNFLLEEEDVRRAFRSLAEALRPGGLLYFDAVTERMMTEHFADQAWTEDTGGFRTTWDNAYDPATKICTTRVKVGGRAESVTRERAYPLDWIADQVQEAGMEVLGVFDAHTWKGATRRSIRADFVAALNPRPEQVRAIRGVAATVRRFLGQGV